MHFIPIFILIVVAVLFVQLSCFCALQYAVIAVTVAIIAIITAVGRAGARVWLLSPVWLDVDAGGGAQAAIPIADARPGCEALLFVVLVVVTIADFVYIVVMAV